MTSHHAPAGGLALRPTKTRSASAPHAGAKSRWTWVCSAGTAAPTSASLSTVLWLMTATVVRAADVGGAYRRHLCRWNCALWRAIPPTRSRGLRRNLDEALGRRPRDLGVVRRIVVAQRGGHRLERGAQVSDGAVAVARRPLL